MVVSSVLLVLGSVLLILLPSKLCNYCGNDNLHIAMELALVFIGIGIVEVYFFMNVASKYVPTSIGEILDMFKDELSSKLD